MRFASTALVRRIFLTAALAGVGGCQPIAAILDKVTPDPVDPAIYAPKKETMLIIVESFQNPSSVEVISEHMDRLIAEELIAFKTAPIVNPDRWTNFRTADPVAYRKMKIPDIGQALGAKQVLYVDISEFTIEAAVGTDALTAHAEARVKIVSAETGETIWPRDSTSAGHRVRVDIPFTADAQNPNESVVREALARGMAEKIAVAFHPHTVGRGSDSPSYPEVGM